MPNEVNKCVFCFVRATAAGEHESSVPNSKTLDRDFSLVPSYPTPCVRAHAVSQAQWHFDHAFRISSPHHFNLVIIKFCLYIYINVCASSTSARFTYFPSCCFLCDEGKSSWLIRYDITSQYTLPAPFISP